MKKRAFVLCLLLLLTGCTGKRQELDRAMDLRARLLGCRSCRFDTEITADYGDEVYGFGMNCTADNHGNVDFTVIRPESIAGITGTVSSEGGKLTFDQTALAFEVMADGQVTPVSAPYVLVKTLRGGYLTACAEEDSLLHLNIDDSYEDNALHLEIWMDEKNYPVRGEIYYDNRRIITVEVENFVLE